MAIDPWLVAPQTIGLPYGTADTMTRNTATTVLATRVENID
jgi:hypothetical protein